MFLAEQEEQTNSTFPCRRPGTRSEDSDEEPDHSPGAHLEETAGGGYNCTTDRQSGAYQPQELAQKRTEKESVNNAVPQNLVNIEEIVKVGVEAKNTKGASNNCASFACSVTRSPTNGVSTERHHDEDTCAK